MSKKKDKKLSKVEQRQQRTQKLVTRTYRAPRDKTTDGGWLPASSYERVPSALSAIRGRARDLEHNNPYASRAVSVLTSHTVGSGIRFSLRGDADYEAAFRAWASSTDCDYEGALNFYGLQSVACRTMYSAGDAFIVIRQKRTEDGIIPTLQLIDPDQLDESASPRTTGNKVVAGVEVDRSGIVVGYHVKTDFELRVTEFVKAQDMIHIFEKLYPGQVRGISRGAQALVRASVTDSFMSAALAKARAESCISAFVTGPNLSDDSSGLIGEIDETDDAYVIPERLEPGTIVPLPDGHDVKMVVPSSSGGIKDYVEISLMSVAVAYGVTYAQLSGDVSKASFSSEKASRLEFYRGVDVVRAHFVMPALMRVEQSFRYSYEASTGRTVEARVSMTAPGRESIEPAKDALSDMTALSAGGLTFFQYCQSRGLDPEDQIAALKAEREAFREAGIELSFGSYIPRLIEAVAAEDAEGADQEKVDLASV